MKRLTKRAVSRAIGIPKRTLTIITFKKIKLPFPQKEQKPVAT